MGARAPRRYRSPCLSLNSQPSTLFPLPLTPFERYMFEDDQPDFPMTWTSVVELDGEFDEERWALSVRQGLAFHPLVRARVKDSRFWVEMYPPGEGDFVRWLSPDDPNKPFAVAPLRMGSEPAILLSCFQGKGMATVVARGHHAAVDGLAGVRLLTEFLRIYESLSALDRSSPDPSLLPLRGELQQQSDLPPEESAGLLRSLLFVIWDLGTFVVRSAVPLRSEGPFPTPEPTYPGFLVHTLDARTSRHVRWAARDLGGTVNDLLVAALFHALAKWNDPEDPFRSRRRLRILIPTSLRSRAHTRMPVCNAVGCAFIERREREVGDLRGLFQNIAKETRKVRRHRLGDVFTYTLSWLDRVPGLLRYVLRRPDTFATAVLSNMGEVATGHPGPMATTETGRPVPRLIRMMAVTPLREGTRASFLVTRCRGEMTITLKTDPRHLGPEASEGILNTFLEALMELCSNSETFRKAQSRGEA